MWRDEGAMGPAPVRGVALKAHKFVRNQKEPPRLSQLAEALNIPIDTKRFRNLVYNNVYRGHLIVDPAPVKWGDDLSTFAFSRVYPATRDEYVNAVGVQNHGPTMDALRQLDMSTDEWVRRYGLPHKDSFASTAFAAQAPLVSAAIDSNPALDQSRQAETPVRRTEPTARIDPVVSASFIVGAAGGTVVWLVLALLEKFL